ncbi:hypothetical protein KPL78_11560 [Roseomonas sp. HJA6]|uniref:DUF2147 domain-containing protein n=1 Tax=Roseomonas alba TaxID=2846776 RepID=A0ABS7A863_9PROT|nr:hypothetical protein [Neoroseomonas alba]MBW6398491.1 hypothetical protein [Neoroseomonas alba]
MATCLSLAACASERSTSTPSTIPHRFKGVWLGPAVRNRQPVDPFNCTLARYTARIGVRDGIARTPFYDAFHDTPIQPDGSIQSTAGHTILIGRFVGNTFTGELFAASRNCVRDLTLQRQPRTTPQATP